ncbi:hypothetical protein RND81_11G168500 [Saponaria officinalis]|uniref:Secreted protein n=1 Tax=Saponaria officinalis TaxID=3572 RepID=A0AAW1HN05_SAPOF
MAIISLFILIFLLSPWSSSTLVFVVATRSLGFMVPMSIDNGQQSIFTGNVLDDCLPKGKFRRDSAPSHYTNEDGSSATLCSNATKVVAPSTP